MHDGLKEDWARFFYCPKTSGSERNQGLDDFETKMMGSLMALKVRVKVMTKDRELV